MKANELRIRNYIYDDFNEVHRVESIESEDFNEYNGMGEPKVIFSKINGAKGFYQCDEVSPIPLTEEWLLKFGFEKLDIDLYKIDNEYFILFFNETYYIADEDWENKKRIIGKGLIYVHQLQNLYFALTGEELTLKP